MEAKLWQLNHTLSSKDGKQITEEQADEVVDAFIDVLDAKGLQINGVTRPLDDDGEPLIQRSTEE